MIAHGDVETTSTEHAAFDEVDRIHVALRRQSPREWEGNAVYLRLEPSRLYTYTDLASATAG